MILLNRTERLAAITLLLLARRRVTASEVARTFEISERTVYRDLQALSEGGLPLIALPGTGGGYELPQSYRLMPLTLTPDEGIALWAAVQAFVASGDHPLREAVMGAWYRIHSSLPEDLRRHVLEVEPSLDVSRMFPGIRVGQAVFASVVQALRERRQLRIRYEVPATARVTDRTIDVYGLACVRGQWYAPAFCHLRTGLRSFRLDRIRDATLLDTRYTLPQSFNLAHWVQQMFVWVPEETDRMTVRIRFSPMAARQVVDDPAFRPFLKRLEDGSFKASFAIPSSDLPYHAELVLRYAGEAVVEEPPELRKEVARVARRLAQLHERPSPEVTRET